MGSLNQLLFSIDPCILVFLLVEEFFSYAIIFLSRPLALDIFSVLLGINYCDNIHMAAYSCQFLDGPIGLTLVDQLAHDGVGPVVVVEEVVPGSQASRVTQLEVGHRLM